MRAQGKTKTKTEAETMTETETKHHIGIACVFKHGVSEQRHHVVQLEVAC
jgi:hypothetical protein